MTDLEKELFAFAKECVNHITKDGYDLLKKMYVLELKLAESTGIPSASIHNPLPEGEPIKEFEEVTPTDLPDDIQANPITGEIMEDLTPELTTEVLDDGLGDLGEMQPLPF